MEAKDLMISDWVKINDIDYPAPTQIGGITKKHGTFYTHFPQWDLTVVDEKLEPISLTQEILEKNGFPLNEDETNSSIQEVYRNFTQFFDFPLGRGFYIEYDTVTSTCWITDHCWFKFKYVHELQHALKLCGIEKEIEL